MVDVDQGNGLITRFAHASQLSRQARFLQASG